MSNTMTVSSKGWVVIPKELREKYGLTPGTKVQVVDYGGQLSLVPIPDNPIEAMAGMFAGQDEGVSWTDLLLAERRQEYAREEAEIQHRIDKGTTPESV